MHRERAKTHSPFIVEENNVDVGETPGCKVVGGKAKENLSGFCACVCFRTEGY